MAKLAASTNAQAKYLLPFLVLPLPFFLPLLIFWLPTQRQYEAKFPTVANLLISPVSSMMVSARICPIPGTVLRKLNSGLSLTPLVTVLSKISICSSALLHHGQVGFDRQGKSGLGNSSSTCLDIERLDPIRADRAPGVARDQILDA